jgi:hypothetical protein
VRRCWVVAVVLAALVILSCGVPPSGSGARARTQASTRRADRASGGTSQERAGSLDPEQVDRTGSARRTGPLDRATAPGWLGEHLFGNGNDWEPAVAADPGAPYVYMLTTRYSGHGPLPCLRCDIPAIALETSADGGVTFGPVSYMPVDVHGGQYDPQIASDAAGDVFAVWINGNFRDVFSTSTDHGVSWSDPVVISRPGGWADHPWLGVSPSGQHIYVAFSHAADWIAQSHDGGQTWLPAVQVGTVHRYHFANGTIVKDDGSVAISNMSYRLGSNDTGSIRLTITTSIDAGTSFAVHQVDTVAQQPNCTNRGCPHDHYGAQPALAIDATGRLLVAYDGALRPLGAQYIWTRTSQDWGVSWTGRKRISPRGRGIIASFTAAVGGAAGDFRVAWQDDRNGYRRWNTFVRASADGGLTWGLEVDVSDAAGGRGYKHPRGYDADYGDYMQVAITSTGKTFAVWGEAFSYFGPGGTWYNVQT